MRKQKLVMLVSVLFLGTFMAIGQGKVKKLAFKKGEVLDILLFEGKPELPKFFPKYKETAFAFALKTGYQPQPLLSVLETTQGGYQPSTFVFGKWTNLSSRKKFLNEILKEVPDFHEQRRAMWSSFYLAYYEMQKDVSLEIDENKVYVATAYWQDGTTEFNTFKKEWLKKVKDNKGKVILELTDAKSSVGYMYKPDYVALIEWRDRSAFDNFLKENEEMGDVGIENVNQFVIQ
ncbi:hypothetical protein [Flagellimonas sp. W118]|uniref:hypothetical protein n=1 Tax=Flagellimonas sp. W118 TaxID=3410791 RepID=UPI003BF57138